MKMVKFYAAVLVAILAVSTPCYAIPALQIYVEGATYDGASDTWVASSSGSLRLWVIGDVGKVGTISDVKISAAYDAAFTPTFTFTPAETGGYLGYTDSTTPVVPTYLQTLLVTDSTPSPVLGDGSYLSSHDVFVPGVAWQEFALGNFTSTDSLIADFAPDSLGALVPQSGTERGQINVYDITISGVPSGFTVHFDAYDHYTAGATVKYKFAPFSHDGETTTVPEPAPLLLLGLSLIATSAVATKRIRRKFWK
jgi:hypothetical protein